MSEADQEDQLHEISFYVQRNIRYHMRRAAFFTRWSRVTSFVGVFLGSAAAVTFLADLGTLPKIIPSALAAVVAILSAVELVVGVSQLAWLHTDLRRRYLDIDERLQADPQMSPEHIRELKSAIRRIEAEEPPTMAALELMARNDVICALYDQQELPKYYIPLPWWERWTANWVNWDTSLAQPKVQAA